MSIAKKNLVSITVERKTRTSDGAGGHTIVLTAITGSPFSGRKIRTRKPVMIDGVASDVMTEQIILVFNVGTVILPEDVCTIDSTKCFKVRAIREYTRSVQADVERLQ